MHFLAVPEPHLDRRGQRNIRAIILKFMEKKRLQRRAPFDNFREP